MLLAGLKPKAVVIVATIRALRHHGGATKEQYNDTNVERVENGFSNLEKHIENMKKFNVSTLLLQLMLFRQIVSMK